VTGKDADHPKLYRILTEDALRRQEILMAFEWLNRFQREMDKSADYATKTLAAYKLGMRAKGSIAGVRIVPDPAGCPACAALDPHTVWHPDDAPRLPLPDCTCSRTCGCVYRPVMAYELDDAGQWRREQP
jgi:hypothetical protein